MTAMRSCMGLGLALALTLATGCGDRLESRRLEGRVLVRYWEKWTGFEADAMQAVVDDFNASQNRIFVERVTISQIDQKFMLAVAGNDSPDVVGLWSHNINDFAEKGALLPLDSALAGAGITRERYLPVIWELCGHRGRQWALPSTPASVALHWNKKLFREAGLDPDKPPASLGELDRMAEQLTVVRVRRNGQLVTTRYPDLTAKEKESLDFEILQIGHLPQEPGWWIALWPYWFGGRLWDGGRRITADEPPVLEAFEWFASQARKYGVDNIRMFGASSGNFSSPQNPFLAGRVAMELQGVWLHNFIEKYAPHFEWGAAPFPSADPARRPDVTVVECDVLAIPRGARHPREAFEFMRYVNTQPAMEKLCLGQRKFSPLADLSPDFADRHPNPNVGVFIRLARSPHAGYVPRLSVWNEYRDEMLVAADQVLTLSTDPASACRQVQRRVQWKFDRVLRRWDLIEAERRKEWEAHDRWGETKS
jgi:ABC-type glycerol-3-phosphate transport system substrate-binding protein